MKAIATMIGAVMVFAFARVSGGEALGPVSAPTADAPAAVQAESPDSMVALAADARGLERIPAEGLRFGTFFTIVEGSGTAQPFPCLPPTEPDQTIFVLAPGIYLVDDTANAGPQREAVIEKQARAVTNLIATFQTEAGPGRKSATTEAAAQTVAAAQNVTAGVVLGAPSPMNSSGGSGSGGSGTTNHPVNYGTNLWLAMLGVSGHQASLVLSNSTPDTLLELQGCTNLAAGNWFSVGFVDGSELTNFTPATIPVSTTGCMFFRIRSWVDTYDTGIPDWWWFEYFGQNTNVNAYAPDPAGDSYDNLAKFDMGLNPNSYYNTAPPGGFFGALDATGTNVFLEWSPEPGPASYVIQRGIQQLNGSYAYAQIGLLNSNATYFEDAGAISSANAQNNIYNLTAVYPGGCVTVADTWAVSWFAPWGGYEPPDDPPMPANVSANVDITGTNVQISWTPITGFIVTNYVIERGIFNTNSQTFAFVPIAQVHTNTTAWTVAGAITNESNWGEIYGVAAVFPGNLTSPPTTSIINVGSTNGPLAPDEFYGYADETGTNIYLTWSSGSGAVTNYLIYGGTIDEYTGGYDYVLLGKVSSSTNFLAVVGAVDAFGNNLYAIYKLVAAYAGGALSQSALWYPGDGTPGPTELYAYVDATGTNVILNWTPVAGAITGYIIQRSSYYGEGTFDPIGQVSANTLSFEDANGVNSGDYGLSSIVYAVQATYPNGGLSAAVTASISKTPPAPSNFSAVVDATGTNVVLTWTPALGSVANYLIEQGVMNPATGTYTYTQIGEVGAGTTSFTASGAAANNSQYVYQLVTKFSNGSLSEPDFANYTQSFTQANLNVAAQLVRNSAGHWQLMFSAFPAGVQSIELDWCGYYYFWDFGPTSLFPAPNDIFFSVNLPVSSITNGLYVIPDWQATNWIGDNALGPVLCVTALGSNDTAGSPTQVGFFPYDAPCFIDGRQHLKQNLLFELREAAVSQPNNSLVENGLYWDPFYYNLSLPADINFVESSFFHWSLMNKGQSSGGSETPEYVKMDDLWPITANYQFNQYLYNTNYTGPASFVWRTNLVTIPAPAVLGVGDPYWISQGFGNLADVAAYTNNGNFYLRSGMNNLYGLAFKAALVSQNPFTTVNPGSSVAIAGANCFFSQTADPGLLCTNYYFAPVNTPRTALAGEVVPVQPYPLPVLTGFASTNQTGLLIASIGSPTVIGGWAKFAIQNGNPAKFAYLGQYFETNAYLLGANGGITTNATGIVSPYGDFFPTAPGSVALVTMPDINTGQQGTGMVRVISLNVDANHDGILDFTYAGPDQTSVSRPFRFWVNDDIDSGDDGGNDGIPGQPYPQADGVNSQGYDVNGNSRYEVHGRRDLVDFFPVYLNIGSLFQSNALSAGIRTTDTNWQFVLSQADGVLRFAYTGLTPTNYMNFLLDTNVSGTLANALLTTITANGVALPPSFMGGIAASNQGVILVEAAAPTTQPLVLTIYHGTNQIAQTQLYLSISGVEQMFRSKTMMLNSIPGTVPDRLTDASVPNEPDTTGKNFVFLHGYNVLPKEARGVQSDMFKRMYWAGSHAKFWAVTWEGADTKGSWPFGNRLTPNYHSNVFNAFLTAPTLANFITTLTNTGPVVVAAHSLGNMVTLSAISDWNAPISQYFMLDAAVPVEAIDPTAVTNMMTFSTWAGYTNRLFAADWYQLFTNNDARSTLFWNNRLANLLNVTVYNFYSSGEEVLRTTTNDPPSSVLSMVAAQAANNLWNGIPFGTYTWYWQEKGKGTSSQDWFLGSSHGGWLIGNTYEYMAPASANVLPTSQLKTNSFCNFASSILEVNPPSGDVALLNSTSGSAYAAANRNRILSDAIPAMSLVAGANPIPSLSPPRSLTEHNFNMNTIQFQNGWSQARTGNEVGLWHHSDFVQMTYTFTYKLFNQFVTTGNLK